MEKLRTDSESDIVNEKYQGPNAAVASAGYMMMSHLAASIVSAIGLGAVGYFAANKTMAVKNAFTRIGETHGQSSNWLIKVPSKVIGWIPKLSEWMVKHLPGGKKISGHAAFAEKETAVAFAGGIGAIAGWIGSTFWGISKGTHEGIRGKRQFDRAKEEILRLREANQDLEKINDNLREKYVEAMSGPARLKNGEKIRISGDEPDQPAPTTGSPVEPSHAHPQTAAGGHHDKPHPHAHDAHPSHSSKDTAAHHADAHPHNSHLGLSHPAHPPHPNAIHKPEHHGALAKAPEHLVGAH
jgi:hypothetical protein